MISILSAFLVSVAANVVSRHLTWDRVRPRKQRASTNDAHPGHDLRKSLDTSRSVILAEAALVSVGYLAYVATTGGRPASLLLGVALLSFVSTLAVVGVREGDVFRYGNVLMLVGTVLVALDQPSYVAAAFSGGEWLHVIGTRADMDASASSPEV